MEHLNRIVKVSIGQQGSNLSPKAITRSGKCAGPLMTIAQQFDKESAVSATLQALSSLLAYTENRKGWFQATRDMRSGRPVTIARALTLTGNCIPERD